MGSSEPTGERHHIALAPAVTSCCQAYQWPARCHGWQLSEPFMSAWFIAKEKQVAAWLSPQAGDLHCSWSIFNAPCLQCRFTNLGHTKPLHACRTPTGLRWTSKDLSWTPYSGPFLTFSLSETLNPNKGAGQESYYCLCEVLNPMQLWGGQRWGLATLSAGPAGLREPLKQYSSGHWSNRG